MQELLSFGFVLLCSYLFGRRKNSTLVYSWGNWNSFFTYPSYVTNTVHIIPLYMNAFSRSRIQGQARTVLLWVYCHTQGQLDEMVLQTPPPRNSAVRQLLCIGHSWNCSIIWYKLHWLKKHSPIHSNYKGNIYKTTNTLSDCHKKKILCIMRTDQLQSQMFTLAFTLA